MKTMEKKKRVCLLLWIFLLCTGFCLSAFAAKEKSRVTDQADLLSEEEETRVNRRLDEISQRQRLDVTVVTADALQGASVQDYAEWFYEACDYGYGETRDGILLLISMEDRDWYLATHGYGITAFTDAGLDYIGEQMLPDLSEGNYAEALEVYAGLCDDFITQARSGTPYGKGTLPRKPFSLIWIPVSLGAGVIFALLVVGAMRAQLKNVRLQRAAGVYLKKNGLQLRESRDLFLYHTVTRKARPKQNQSGSSTHSSASGRSYGGRGGKF